MLGKSLGLTEGEFVGRIVTVGLGVKVVGYPVGGSEGSGEGPTDGPREGRPDGATEGC